MNPELEATADEREEFEAAYRELCAAEFDALYALEAAREQEPALPVASDDEIPW